MKKLISVLLSVIMIFGIFTVAYAAEAEEAYSEYPVILVPGFGSTVLTRTDPETGEEIAVWSDMVKQVGEGGSLEAIVPDFLDYLITGKVDKLAATLADGFNRIFGGAKCNPDGSSYYADVKSVITTAEEANYANLREKYPEGDFQYESEIMATFAEKVGYENLYVFCTDFRKGSIDAAADLRAFVDDVIRYTNKLRAKDGKAAVDKVNLFAVSHGGQVAGTYLTLYGYEGKVNNAVLTIPALGGAGLAIDAFDAKLSFDEVGILTFIQHGFMMEEDYHILLEAEKLGFLDDLTNAIAPLILDTLGYWGCLWDFMPLEYYDYIKDKLLDPVESKELIEKSDRMHYEIMSPEGKNYYAKGFKKAQKAGTNIYIMAGYDIKNVTGLEVSSDGIIPTAGATGATVAPYGERFADGYVQKVNTGFYQVSPSMTVDASTAYLPEHTWLVEDYYHGMTAKDEYTFSLLHKLLFTDKSYNVNSLEGYNQFHATTNPAHAVFAAFDKSAEGYVSSDDTVLTVKNICRENSIFVTAVNVNGADIRFDVIPFVLGPGESKEIEMKGALPEVSLMNFEINVAYLMGTVTPMGSRTFEFTVMNGAPVVYDKNSPLVKADMTQKINTVIGTDVTDRLAEFGVDGIVSNVFDIVYPLFSFIYNLVDFFRNIAK